MVFSSLEFLFFLLPIVFIGGLIIPAKLKNAWLLLASLVFYFLAGREQIFVLLAVIIVAYISGLVQLKVKTQKGKKAALAVSVAVMLLAMTYFKYWEFLLENINNLFSTKTDIANVMLPIGISFFTFQAVSYVVDVYRGEKALKNPVDMALYISFFPQLIAGPIVRFHDISEYLDKKYRKVDWNNIAAGVWRFAEGLCKKVLLANNLAGLADTVFSVSDISRFSVLYTWLGAIAFTLQIYFDFSGYSDMAIGLGKIFGFEFKENFNYPYISSSIKDFWHRWHISLSQFFRDYVYIPMGGNRVKKVRWIFNILVVWFLTGLWHGAAWGYILWGFLYGILLLAEELILSKTKPSRLRNGIGHIYTLIVVILLWVVFKTESVTTAFSFIKNMFGAGSGGFAGDDFLFQIKNYWVLIAASILFSLPVVKKLDGKAGDKGWYKAVKAVLLAALVFMAVSYIFMGSYNPFLYFMF